MKQRKPLQRRTPLKTKKGLTTKQPLRASKSPSKRGKCKKATNVPKTKNKGYKPPKWFNRLKIGSHGNTPAQKRYWKVLSDLYRQEDYATYNGTCPLCHRHLEDWKQLQLGHFHRWSVCNAWFKFERKNLLSICAACNVHDGGLTSYRFAEVLKQKYGQNHISWIEQENEKYRGQKLETHEIVERVANLCPQLVTE